MEFFDEMLVKPGDDKSQARDIYAGYHDWYGQQTKKTLKQKLENAHRLFRRVGITFNVYGDKEQTERLIPFDIVPRIIDAPLWQKIQSGIEQRGRAINAFLHDVYHDQEILKAGIIPRKLIDQNEAYEPQMIGFTPPGGIYTHIMGSDIVRTGENDVYILEDNCRTPSGVSYMLENRETMLRLFPRLFVDNHVARVNHYPTLLGKSLRACAPERCQDEPVIAVLTPGVHNSAYYEHSFLADRMGAELVEGSDLRLMNGKICMRTTEGYKPIDIIYRRVDDAFLDPLNFNPESILGVAGIMDVYRSGGITIANAPGAGIADDKAVYAYMPDIIKFYTGQEPILENVPTYRCSEDDDLKYVLDHLSELVVKEVHGSGGYGMLVGPKASKKEIKTFEKILRDNPDNYIAQPTLALSTVPIIDKKGLQPRHVDLRPFALFNPDTFELVPGGLTRVAMKKGSLVVNSSQGGGTKDTWVLEG